MRGYEHANGIALDLWEEIYPNNLTLLALTDTFSTKAFFQVRARSLPPSPHAPSPPRSNLTYSPRHLCNRTLPPTRNVPVVGTAYGRTLATRSFLLPRSKTPTSD